MLNDIIIGISQALDAKFPGSDIHVDEIQQDLNPPCFLIVSLMNTEVQKLGDRYWREHSFDIHYFPQNIVKPFREAATVGGALQTVLEYITVNGALVRGTERRYELVDGVLHFFVNYNVFVRKIKDPADYMETLEHSQLVKGD